MVLAHYDWRLNRLGYKVRLITPLPNDLLAHSKSLSVKMVGLFVTALVGAYTLEDLWEKFGDTRLTLVRTLQTFSASSHFPLTYSMNKPSTGRLASFVSSSSPSSSSWLLSKSTSWSLTTPAQAMHKCLPSSRLTSLGTTSHKIHSMLRLDRKLPLRIWGGVVDSYIRTSRHIPLAQVNSK